MNIHILLTETIKRTMPSSCRIIKDFGEQTVTFDNITRQNGLNCVIKDTEENIVSWLGPFDGVVVGVGSPVLEKFQIAHIKEELLKK